MADRRELTPKESGAMFTASLEESVQQNFIAEVRTLRAFLRRVGAQHATLKGDPRTNIIDQNEKKTYDFPPLVLAELFNHLEACRRAGAVCHFSERQANERESRSGLYIDIDLEHYEPGGVLGSEHYECLAGHIGSLLADMFDPAGGESPAQVEYEVFVTAKKAPVPLTNAADESGAADGSGAADPRVRYDDGLHILVPGAQMGRAEKKLFFQQLAESGAMADSFADIEMAVPVTQVLDHASASSPALFFGSAKKGRREAYVLADAYSVRVRRGTGVRAGQVSVRRLDIDKFQQPIVDGGANLVAELALGSGATPPKYPGDRPPVVRRAPLELRPAYLSLLPPEEEVVEDAATVDDGVSVLICTDPRASTIHAILDLLPPDKYVADYDNWRRVVFALANTSAAYLPLAEWFTRRCPEKTAEAGSSRPEKLRELWRVGCAGAAKIRAGGLTVHRPVTIRSVYYWASQENPDKYRQIMQKDYYQLLKQMVYEYRGRLQHTHVAKLLFAMLGDKFAVDRDPAKKGRGIGAYSWYEFVVPGDSHISGQEFKWREEPEPSTLLNYISDVIPNVYRDLMDHLEEERDSVDNDPNITAENAKAKKKYFTTIATALFSSRGQLNNTTYKNGVLREAVHRFIKRGFAESLDGLPDVLGVGNGVLHIASKDRPQSMLIQHYHELPVSRFTRTAFIPYSATEYKGRYLLNMFRNAVPEPDAQEKLLCHYACAISHRAEAVLLYMWGGGSNGKTTYARLTKKAIGEYGTKVLMSLLTESNNDPTKPNSALMRLKQRTYGYLDESYAGAVLQETMLKRLINEGDVTDRDLNGKQEEFPVTWTLSALSNHKLVFNTTDHGTWRRILTYQFKVRFVEDPDPNNPYERKCDPDFMTYHVEDPEYHTAWLSILNHYWEKLVNEYGGRISHVPSPTIERESTEFRIARDTLHRFLIEHFIVTNDPTSAYTADTVAQRYIQWHHRAIGRSTINPEEIIDRLEESVVKQHIRTRANGARYLVGCRILEEGEIGELGEGEKFLVARDAEFIRKAKLDKREIGAVENNTVLDGKAAAFVQLGDADEYDPVSMLAAACE